MDTDGQEGDQTPIEVATEVHDNGHGLPEDGAANVLTPFFSTNAGGAVFLLVLPAA